MADRIQEVRKKAGEEAQKGYVVIIHPAASKKFQGARVKRIDHPR